MVAEISVLLDNRLNHLRYLLAIQEGDAYYMNVVRLEKRQLAYLDHNFPLKVNTIVRLGLSFGSLLSYPISNKINTFLKYILNILNENPLSDERTLEAAINAVESEFHVLYQKEQQLKFKRKPLLPSSPTVDKSMYSRRPKNAKSIGDLNRFINLQIDTITAQDSFPKNNRVTSPSTVRSPSSSVTDSSSLKKSLSSNRLKSKLRKMKSSNSLWSTEQARTRADWLAKHEIKYSKPDSTTENVNRLFSEKNFPINMPMDNLYSLTNLLKILIKLFAKIADHVEKQRRCKTTSPVHNLHQLRLVNNYTSAQAHNLSTSNPRSFTDYQPPKLLHSSSSFSSLSTGHSSSSNPEITTSVPYNGPISSPNTMKTSSSVHNSMSTATNTNLFYGGHNSDVSSVPLSPFSSQSTSVAAKKLPVSNSITSDMSGQHCANQQYNHPETTNNLKRTEPIFYEDLSAFGINAETIELFEIIDLKMQNFIFEPVFEVLDCICEHTINKEMVTLVDCLSFDDDDDDGLIIGFTDDDYI